jgi:hypothetical protein
VAPLRALFLALNSSQNLVNEIDKRYSFLQKRFHYNKRRFITLAKVIECTAILRMSAQVYTAKLFTMAICFLSSRVSTN